MSLANILVLLMAVQCFAAAVLYAMDKQSAQAVMFAGYFVANLGILWTALR